MWHWQELNHTEDPDDGLFWMAKEDAFKYFWSFTVCMTTDTSERRPESEITDAQRQQRKALREQTSGMKQIAGDAKDGTPERDEKLASGGWRSILPKLALVGSAFGEKKAGMEKKNVMHVERSDLQKLPPGWEAKVDTKSGKYFYVNHEKRVMSWVPPDASIEVPAVVSKSPSPVPGSEKGTPRKASAAADLESERQKQWMATRTDWLKYKDAKDVGAIDVGSKDVGSPGLQPLSMYCYGISLFVFFQTKPSIMLQQQVSTIK